MLARLMLNSWPQVIHLHRPPKMLGLQAWASMLNWKFLKELKVELPFNPAIPLLGIYPMEKKSLCEKDTCTHMFIAAQFTIAKIWNQPKCPSTNEWIKKLWYVYAMEYYSAIKSDETMSFAATWMKLEVIILSEVTQEWKIKYYLFSLLSQECILLKKILARPGGSHL